MRIIVDADACPRDVLETCLRSGSEHGIKVITVASFNHNISNADHICVGDSPEETDLRIANLVRERDLVVTQDIGLAAIVLSRRGRAVNTVGREYTAENIDLLLAERAASARRRRGGHRTRGPRARRAEDRTAFAESLEQLLHRVVRS